MTNPSDPTPATPPTRRPILIEHVAPSVDDGRHDVKRVVGDQLEVSADILRDGHDRLAAVIRYQCDGDGAWREATLQSGDNDRWSGAISLDAIGRWRFTVAAWTDTFGSWVEEMRRRIAGGQRELGSEILEGRALVERAATGARGEDGAVLRRVLAETATAGSADQIAALLDTRVRAAMARGEERADLTCFDRELGVTVDRARARFASWYELFPRSQGRVARRHGTFADCIERLPDIQRMGFDVLYLPPIHPIGRTNRKGRNNSLVAAPGDPGSPWAIGGAEGGHAAVHPDLGTLEDFSRLVDAATEHGMEVALDFALQCSPDHPWVREHPEWFSHRPDGSIKYAENPPKKYQDIFPLNFASPAWRSLWTEILGVVLFWVERGVLTFRVDNPHTKPLDFWQWLIAEVHRRHPAVIFLAEAFTRPKMMRALAKIGFTQSYTYFTWRNTREELTEYLEELTGTEMAEYFRGNFFVNTPDILPEVLQRGGPAAFKMRAALAATLSPLWGIYSGFELAEGDAVPGTEEYLDSEKYEIAARDWDRPGHLKDFIARLNRIRREHACLQTSRGIRFCPTDSPHVLAYVRTGPAGEAAVLAAVNLDPWTPRSAQVDLPLAALGIPPDETYALVELLTDVRALGRGPTLAVHLDPAASPAAIWRLARWRRREQHFEYFSS
ncbi:MAG TPA: alpha-1,4-glucan--maltose-1-phosphate maltosyltransferase [Candidatus Binatia bacterium]|nr:alpha-1,4-glucan--maltose-1-phosphate maltosyltransferase [Candidatus Binatia bacterium]